MQPKIYVTSDTHFCHKRILEFCPNTRRGSDWQEMDRLLVEMWNDTVRDHDIVYHLGDFCFSGEYKVLEEKAQSLRGEIHLILGNHDNEQRLRRTGAFKSINKYLERNICGEKIVMFHYPIYEWNRIHHGAYHFYGHVHGRKLNLPEGRSMDVGIDGREDKTMALYSVEELIEKLKDKPIRGHHEKCN